MNIKCETLFDRFSFDVKFKKLLLDGLTHEEVLNDILFTCSLSTIIFQERIYNNYYKKIIITDMMPDLVELLNEA